MCVYLIPFSFDDVSELNAKLSTFFMKMYMTRPGIHRI